jgi:hypothetical protein
LGLVLGFAFGLVFFGAAAELPMLASGAICLTRFAAGFTIADGCAGFDRVAMLHPSWKRQAHDGRQHFGPFFTPSVTLLQPPQ